MKIYDAYGQEMDWEWVKEKYNLPDIERAPKDKDHWEVVALHENCQDSSMTVRALAVDGLPAASVIVHFSWPDGDAEKLTNAEGDAGFGMGGGAYYQPPQEGPHWVSVGEPVAGDLIMGLGMLGKRNHWHLEPTFQFVKASSGEPPAEECKDCPRYRKALSEIHAIVAEVLG